MTDNDMANEPTSNIIEAVTIALDEQDIPGWMDRWHAASRIDQQKMETEIVMDALVRNHGDRQRHDERQQFRDIVGGE
jgi:hypothetical protein